MLIGMVDTIFADVAQPDQARIVSINAQYFLKNEGHFVISIKVSYYLFGIFELRIIIILFCFQANCIDSTAEPAAVFAQEIEKLKTDKLKPTEQLTLEPYERDHAVVVGVFRPVPKAK